MTLKYIATAVIRDDMTAVLADFAASIGRNRVAPGRYSFALVLGLFGGFKSGHQNPAKIMCEIEALEGSGPPSQLKGLHRCGSPLFRQRMQEAQDAGEVRYVTQEDVASLADDIAHGNWQRMASAASGSSTRSTRRPTIYLCLGRHDSGDDCLRRQIDAI
jgi:hypothetical protein